MNVPATRKDFMIVNIGPHHPSMHGVLRLILSLDGEDVIDCEPILLFTHRDWKNYGKPNNYNICLRRLGQITTNTKISKPPTKLNVIAKRTIIEHKS